MKQEQDTGNKSWLPDKAVLEIWGGRTITLNWWQTYLIILGSVVLVSSLIGGLFSLAMRLGV